jgi:tellurite resistance protein TerC
VLAWGVLGALVMRGAMIAAGAALVARFDWIIQVFGVFLVYTGAHMLWKHDKSFHYEKHPVFRFANSHLRMTPDYRGGRFFVREKGLLYATPLVLVLLIVEITDVTFAVDSIPAVFGITHDAFIVYTSNIFAILGLRTLYFLLAGVLGYFRYLSIGLALVLVFVGGKMMADRWVHFPVGASLAVVGGILSLAVVVSLLKGPAKTNDPPAS